MAFFDKDPNYHALHEHCLFEVRDGNKSSTRNNVNVMNTLTVLVFEIYVLGTLVLCMFMHSIC